MKGLYRYIIDKKLYHPIFWISFVLFWMATFDGFNKNGLLINLIYLVTSAVPVYINSRVLMRRFLYKNRYFIYFISLISIIVLFSFLLWLGLAYHYKTHGINTREYLDWPNGLGPTLGAVSCTVLLLMIFEVIRNSIRTNQVNRNLEKEKLENELKYLKSQLNPHFLFNTLNNIYFLIQKDQDKAAEALAGFSEMLRYQLYECNVEKIPLAQEIKNVENYIRVASMSHDDLKLEVNIDENVNGEMVTPLLLMPFIENAFKYVSNKSSAEKSIKINLDLKDNLLAYHVDNSFDHELVLEETRGGIGLENMKRRLGILYPDKHQLSYGLNGSQYFAKLNLEL